MNIHTDAVPIAEDSIEDTYELPCPECGFSPLAVFTETGRGNEAYLSDALRVCEHRNPPAGESVYYLHVTERL